MLESLAGAGLAGEGATRRIVVVDDDPVLRAILRGYLEDAGYRVTEAADGDSLLDALPRLDPALMLLDVKLPGADGFELLRAIRARSASMRGSSQSPAAPPPPAVSVVGCDASPLSSNSIRRHSSSGENGLTTRSSIPAASQAVASDGSTCAVRAMIGGWARCKLRRGRVRMRFAASKPSMSGRRMSISTTSTRWSRTI